MKELPKCDVEGCEKKARSLKGGFCQMHYTRERTHGDVNVNLYADRGQQKWELPDGRIISEGKKIKNLNIIIERIKNKRLLGYQNHDDALDIIEKVLDDSHEKYKSGGVKRGAKTLMYAKYVDVLANSDWGFEHELITIEQSKLISKVISELSKNRGAIKFWDICENLEIKLDDIEWLIKLFTKHLIIGIIYNPKEKTIEFSKEISWFFDELQKKSNLGIKLTNNDALEVGLHYKRFKSYWEYDEFKSEQYDYSILVSIAVEKVIKCLIENGDTEENILYEKCNTNQIMLQQMIDNNVGIIKNNKIVKFSIVPKIQELIKKEKQMWDSLTTENGLTKSKILDHLGINYVEYATLEAVKKNKTELV